MNRRLTAALMAAGAALTVTAAPAMAEPAPVLPLDALFGSLSGTSPEAPAKPGAPAARNGVAALSLTVSNWFGRQLGPDIYDKKFAPGVRWSARDRSNAEVKGKNCQIEVQFPGTDFPTYKSAACQGNVGFTSSRYKTPGRYSIVVVDKVSGARTVKTFTIE